MNIIIIEDEEISAQDLAQTIVDIEPRARIIAILGSVKEGRQYFASLKEDVDLIFSDIQLGDGTSFDIFEKSDLQVPVIFCTAYDEFALKAFDNNGIDYILKPIDEKQVSKAIKKFNLLTGSRQIQSRAIQEIISLVKEDDARRKSILVYHKDRIIPIETSSIAYFFVKKSVIHIATFDDKKYLMTTSLDDLEKTAGRNFFRANRQFLVNRKAVVQATNRTSRKLTVELSVQTDEQVLISKEKMPQFLTWLSSVS